MISTQLLTNIGLDLSTLAQQANLLELLYKTKQQQLLLQQQQQKLLAVAQQHGSVQQQIQHQESVNSNTAQQNANRYKTELCRSYQENGVCKYGDKCQFAHGMAEMRNMVRHPKYKTELCRTFHATGYCPYGPRCHFVHDTQEASLKRDQPIKCSSGKSSSSVSPAATQICDMSPLSIGLELEMPGLRVQQQSTSPAIQPSRATSGSSLLMFATDVSTTTTTSHIGSKTRLNSIDSAFGLSDSISPASSRSLSPDSFHSSYNQTQQPIMINKPYNDQHGFVSTNDLFYSMLNQRSYSTSSGFMDSKSSASSVLSSSSSSSSSYISSHLNDMDQQQDCLVNQILNQIYSSDMNQL